MYPFIEIWKIKIYIFPIILIIAIYSCILIFIHSAKYDKFYFKCIKKSSIYCIICSGIVGKLIYMGTILNNNDLFKLYDLFGGFVFYGGLIGAILGLMYFCKKKKARFFDILDVYASLLPLGQAIGRLGCFFNGCCYGKEYHGFFAINYPVNGEQKEIFPTWFFESFVCFLLFVCFFCISKRLFSGIYSSIYLIVYASFRSWIELYRGDSIRGVWYGISTSQFISLGFFVVGVIFLIISIKLKDKNLLIKGRI